MAWQTGPFRFVGTFSGLTFCRNGVVRSARRSQQREFDTAPSMARTRENATEFGTASRAAALLRGALRPQLGTLHTRALCSRLTSQMRQLLALDTENPRGQRQLLPQNLAALAGFSLNPAAILPPALADGCLLQRPTPGQLTLSLPALPPDVVASAPAGATHVALQVTVALLDLRTATSHHLPLTGLPAPAPLVGGPFPALTLPATLPAGLSPAAVIIVSVGLTYHQHHAGHFSPLLAARHRPIAIVLAQPLATLALAAPPPAHLTTQPLTHRPLLAPAWPPPRPAAPRAGRVPAAHQPRAIRPTRAGPS